MEEMLNAMETAVISTEPIKSDFESLYKNWGKFSNQEERRKELLEAQKCQRNNKIDKFRGILDLVNSVEDNDIFQEEEREFYKPSIYVAGFNRVGFSYKNVLMLSEWIVERPRDLEQNWYVVACPKGIRMLIVANQGKTRCFTKYGQLKIEVNSHLPGGNASNIHTRQSCCVLDGFYHVNNNTMYVIDFLAWNNQPMTDCDTEFRDYWLQSQFKEMPELAVVSKKNRVKFVLLPKVLCTKEGLNKFMMKYPQFEKGVPPLDGLLFYHKLGHYQSGQTPLVGWLFPFMVHEILGADITVHEKYLACTPRDYVDQATFIKSFEAKMASKKSCIRRPGKSNAMDTSDVKPALYPNTPKSDAIDNGCGDATTAEMEADELPDTTDRGTGEPKTPIMEADELPDTTDKQSGEVKTPVMEAEEMPDTTIKGSGEVLTSEILAEEMPNTTIKGSTEVKTLKMEAEEMPDTTDKGSEKPIDNVSQKEEM